MRFSTMGLAAFTFLCASPAMAQETTPPEPVTVTGSITLASDYRFRGVSQTDKEMTIQGGVEIGHESGVYAGAWGSNLSGWGTFGGANMELDLYAGVRVPLGGGTLDAGVLWYMYPGGADVTDFAEPYIKLSGTTGPVSLVAGVAYAPSQRALGRVFFDGAAAAAGLPDDPDDKEDNLYLWGDARFAVPSSPITLKGHIGYSDGNAGLGPNGTSIAPTGRYWDWMLGADVTWQALTFGVSYVDTDISRAESAYLLPNFQKTTGGDIAGSTILLSVTAAF